MNTPNFRKTLIAIGVVSGIGTGALAAQTTTTETSKSIGETIGDVTESTGAALGDATEQTQRVTSDTWITTKVKSAIYADSISQGYEVGVSTLHGAVVLVGDLTNQQSIDHVTSITKGVKGVKSVDTSGLTIQ